MLMMRGPFSSYKYLCVLDMCVCVCVWAECGQRLRPLLSDEAFSSVGASRWPFSRPSLAPVARVVTRLPQKAEFMDMFTKLAAGTLPVRFFKEEGMSQCCCWV